MINALIRFSISQKLVVLLLVVIMAGAGVYSLLNLPIDAVPDVTNVQVQVLTSAPSLAPLEIERQITFPVETAMSGIPNVEEIRSVSKFGISNVTIVFTESTDIYFARQLILERLAAAREQIPSEIGSPELGPIATGLGEIYQYEVKAAPGSNYTATDLRTIHDWNIRRQLMSVPGITEVNSHGGYGKQYEVRLSPEKLQSYGLTLRDVYESVTRNNGTVGGGYIEKGAEQYLLRGVGLVEKWMTFQISSSKREKTAFRFMSKIWEKLSSGKVFGKARFQPAAKARSCQEWRLCSKAKTRARSSKG